MSNTTTPEETPETNTEVTTRPNKGIPNGERKIFNVKSVLELKYEILDFGTPTDGLPAAMRDHGQHIRELISVPERNFNGMAYGASGSGKSTWVLKFAWLFSLMFGKTLYATYEERTNKTLQDRIINLGISKANAPKLYFGRDLTFEEVKHKIKSNHYKLVVIDSVQYSDFTIDMLHDLRLTFKRKKIAFFFVSFGTSKGKTDGAKDLLHASDVKLYFHNGKVLSHGRYIEQQIEKVLFTPLKQEEVEESTDVV